MLRAVGHRAVDARLEVAARDVLGAGQVAASHSSLSRTSMIATPSPASSRTSDGIDLVDLRLDAADVLAAGHAHGRFTLKSVGIRLQKV